jgi:hypothetical protein
VTLDMTLERKLMAEIRRRPWSNHAADVSLRVPGTTGMLADITIEPANGKSMSMMISLGERQVEILAGEHGIFEISAGRRGEEGIQKILSQTLMIIDGIASGQVREEIWYRRGRLAKSTVSVGQSNQVVRSRNIGLFVSGPPDVSRTYEPYVASPETA